MALWLYSKSFKLVRDNDKLWMENARLRTKLLELEGTRIVDVRWRGWSVTSPGVNVGLDPTEKTRITLEAEGHEAEKVITALKDARKL